MALFSSLLKLGQNIKPSTVTAVRSLRFRTKKKKLQYVYEFYKPGVAQPSAQETHKNFEVNVAPKLKVAYTGSVYDTQIKRKNEIRNPNLPLQGYWDSTKESLKWTDWRMMRDVNRRLAAAEYFSTRYNVEAIVRNRLLPDELRQEAHKDLYHFPVKSHPHTTNNRCAITSRGRGKLISWRLSRIVFRHIVDYNNMSGLMKSCWGP